MPSQWLKNAINIGIRTSPFLTFPPNGIYRADALCNRLDNIQVAQDSLLMRNSDTEAGDWKSSGRLHPIRELRRWKKKGQIHGIDAAGLKSPVVNDRRFGMCNRI